MHAIFNNRLQYIGDDGNELRMIFKFKVSLTPPFTLRTQRTHKDTRKFTPQTQSADTLVIKIIITTTTAWLIGNEYLHRGWHFGLQLFCFHPNFDSNHICLHYAIELNHLATRYT